MQQLHSCHFQNKKNKEEKDVWEITLLDQLGSALGWIWVQSEVKTGI
jgi:hypothetical protein